MDETREISTIFNVVKGQERGEIEMQYIRLCKGEYQGPLIKLIRVESLYRHEKREDLIKENYI